MSLLFNKYVVFIGDTAPYHITHPPTDDYIQIISPNATTANLTCALNITIPRNFIVYWIRGDGVTPIRSPKIGKATTLLLRDLQPSDFGTYHCEFVETSQGWKLRRTIILGQYVKCYMYW